MFDDGWRKRIPTTPGQYLFKREGVVRKVAVVQTPAGLICERLNGRNYLMAGISYMFGEWKRIYTDDMDE